MNSLKLSLAAGVALIGLATVAAAAPAPGKFLDSPRIMSAAQLKSLETTAVPAEMRATSLPAAATSSAPPVASRSLPLVREAGAPSVLVTAPVQPNPPPPSGGRNFGNNPFGSGTNQGTIYHYTDRVVDTNAVNDGPFHYTGKFFFTDYANRGFSCSATLISQSILITAGHCVHDQTVHGAAGWIKSGYFVPSYTNGSFPFGYATANWINTTGNWYNSGQIQQGYDVGIVVLNRRAGFPQPLGYYIGWSGFCYSGCLQAYWELTQLGYPGNYNSGLYMQEGLHIETNRNNTDFYMGSGMQGGSSGGPHTANLGYLADSTTNKGLWPYRNYVFAVTSWGYISDLYKIQGASSLSGPNNSNNFTALYNTACNRAKLVIASNTCTTF